MLPHMTYLNNYCLAFHLATNSVSTEGAVMYILHFFTFYEMYGLKIN